MHVNNYDLTPPQDLLDRCCQVILSDPVEPMWRMKKWARAYCQSFVWAELVDTSDVSYQYDSVSAFYFSEEKDALMFQLKYKH
jgi:hypothetical protein